MADRQQRTHPQAQVARRAAGLQQESQKPRQGAGLAAVTPAVQLALQDPAGARPADILALQPVAGNRAVSRLIQAKLTVGPAGDRYEQEADRVAEQVMAASDRPPRLALGTAGKPGVQRQEDEDEVQAKPLASTLTPLVQRQEDEDEVRTKPEARRYAGRAFDAGPSLERRLAATRGAGSPLPAGVRAYMEPRFGADFSRVRLHTGAAALQMNKELSAQAFTHGRDIYLGAGAHAPGTDRGNRLLAHELAHTLQQGAAPAGSRLQKQAPGVLQRFTKEAGKQVVDTVRTKAPAAANRLWDIIKTRGRSMDKEHLTAQVLNWVTQHLPFGSGDFDIISHRAAIAGLVGGAVCDNYSEMGLAELARRKDLLQPGDEPYPEAYVGHSYLSVQDGQHPNDRGMDMIVDPWRGFVDRRKSFHVFRKYSKDRTEKATGYTRYTNVVKDARSATVDWLNDPYAIQVLDQFLKRDETWQKEGEPVDPKGPFMARIARGMGNLDAQKRKMLMKDFQREKPSTRKWYQSYPI